MASVLEELVEADKAGEYEIACEANLRGTPGIGKLPTLSDFLAYIPKHGPDQVLESALHLKPDQYEILKVHVNRAKREGSDKWKL